MKVEKSKISPISGVGGSSVISMQQINNLLKTTGGCAAGTGSSGGINKNISPSSQHDFNIASAHRSPSLREVRKLKTNT